MTKYPIEVFWSDEDGGYIAVVPDLAGCNAWGKTEAAAIREAVSAARVAVGDTSRKPVAGFRFRRHAFMPGMRWCMAST